MNTDTIITLLRWAAPVCFGLHVIEELIWPGTFIEWYHGYRPQLVGKPRSYYHKMNFFYFIATLLVPLAPNGNYALLFASGLLFSNLVFTHIRGAIKTRSYSPGIVTGLLYIPLFVASYAVLLSQHVVSVPAALACLALSPLSEVYFAMKKADPVAAAA